MAWRSIYGRTCLSSLSRCRIHSSNLSTNAAEASTSQEKILSPEEQELKDALFRKRKTDWKRRQGGQSFLDNVVINIRAGKGGDGCVAFHREKFKPYGPPSGAKGGRGGDIYIMPTPHLTSLSSVPRRVRGEAGGNGQGTWQNGRNGAPLVIKVPLGTVVRELTGDDPRRAKNEWEAEEETLEGLDKDERRTRWRERRWVHYPQYEDDNVQRLEFKEAEWEFFKAEREIRAARRQREASPITLDLDKLEDTEQPVDAPLGQPRTHQLGHLVASGGIGGYGNSHFLTMTNRSPKFATRGYDGERVTLALELKILADIGLVGMPNAGKSTLLRALTAGRAKSEVASYAFTTLNPVVGVVRVAEDGSFVGGGVEEMVHDETWVEEKRHQELMETGAYAGARTRNQSKQSDEPDVEMFRFTIADNPGLISQASENVGLGHSFLRSMERSLALAYVVDFAGPAPWDEIRVLRDELEKYKPGMSKQARLVIANKADLLGAEGDGEDVDAARLKLQQLQEFVRTELATNGRAIDVIPASAKFSQNLRIIVRAMRSYVEDAQKPVALSLNTVGVHSI
ncbi:GTPase [Auriscalpium vulgare]|uniref:GTPase n=1 Tax=Auriscalpium vulgare TaxID=40419 RepID=A0ACB8RS07_9AGAM|nr:GTPase [Auriscalpium vulgare]